MITKIVKEYKPKSAGTCDWCGDAKVFALTGQAYCPNAHVRKLHDGTELLLQPVSVGSQVVGRTAREDTDGKVRISPYNEKYDRPKDEAVI